MIKKRMISILIIAIAVLLLKTDISYAATTVSAPTGVKAESAGYNNIKVSWGAVSGVNGYKLYRATSLTGTYSYINSTTSKSYVDSGLTSGKSYYYKVIAFKTSRATKVYSKFSSAVNTKPVPITPTGLNVTSSSYNTAKLSWTSVSGASGYEVYSATSSTGTFSYMKKTASTSYNLSDLTTGKTYYYKVRAYSTVGTVKIYSNYSATANVKSIPSTPTNLVATSESDTKYNISWSEASGATGYQVYRATSSDGYYSLLNSTASAYYQDSDLERGTSYFYKVRAYCTDGSTKVYSNYSSVLEIVTGQFDPQAAAQNITGEFTDLGDGVIAILTNHNSYPINMEASIVFYDANGLMLDQSTDDNSYFEAGKESALYFAGPKDNNFVSIPYSSYKINYSIDNTDYQISNLSDIQITSNLGSDNVMVAATNSGSQNSEYTLVGIVFYKDGKAIDYDYGYAECKTPGSTDYLEFSLPHDENYDPIQIDSYKVYANYSYRYSW